MTMVREPPGAVAQIAGLLFSVILLDRDLTIVEANPAAEDLLGRSAARLRGTPFFAACRIADTRVAESLREAEGQFIARGVTVDCGGRELRVDFTASPVHAHPGWKVVTLSEVGHREDRGPGDARSSGAPSILAHEIKNPLAAIRGAAQLLARRSDTANRSLAELIGSEVDRIARLVDRMQQLGRTGSAPLRPVNLHLAIRTAIATVRVGRPEGPTILEEFDPSLPPASGQREALEQVLINLLANACDALADNPQGVVRVRTRFVSGLAIRALTLGRAVRLPIEITVSDNGPGIPADLRDHVFRPFVSGKPHGQGLGLALVRKLVGDMGGRIAHDRDRGEGLTHFRINLAVADQEVA